MGGHHHHHHHGGRGHHHHAPNAATIGNPAARRALLIALGLNAGYTVVQAVVGFVVGSVALLADAGHNLSDVLALAIALGAASLAMRPATPSRSWGYRRAEILAALANALSLVAIGAVVVVESARRLTDPPDVDGTWLVVVAAGGILVNVAGALVIRRAQRGRDLNMNASFLHLAWDAVASLGVVVAGLLVIAFGWNLADPLIALAIGVLILFSAWGVLREATLVLLEAAPTGMDADEIGYAMAAHPGVREVHDLHVWSISSDFPALSAHVIVDAGDDCHQRRRELESMLAERFGVGHTTLQMEHRQRHIPVRIESPGGAADDAGR